MTLSEQMMQQLAAFKESQPLGVSEDGAVDGDGVQPVEPSLTLVAFGTESDGQVTELASAKVGASESAPANGPARAPRRAPAAGTLADMDGNTAGDTTGSTDGDTAGSTDGNGNQSGIMTYSAPGGKPTALSLLLNVYPEFTVEYYARIDHPAEAGGTAHLPFIDTSLEGNQREDLKNGSGGVLPGTPAIRRR